MDAHLASQLRDEIVAIKATMHEAALSLRELERRCEEYEPPESAWDIGRQAYEWKLHSHGTDQQFADRVGEKPSRIAAARRANCYALADLDDIFIFLGEISHGNHR